MPMRNSDFANLDGRPGGVRIERTIPLWGIITVIGAIAAQGFAVINGQDKQAIQLTHQAAEMAKMAAKLDALSTEANTKNTKDMEQDLRLAEYSRRLILVEGSQAPTRGAR